MAKNVWDVAEDLLLEETERALTQGGRATEGGANQTMVNGHAIDAFWSAAQGQRVQSFLDESLWKAPAYDVTLPVAALGAPCNLADGSLVQRLQYGWRGVVRRIDVEDRSVVVALVTLTTGN